MRRRAGALAPYLFVVPALLAVLVFLYAPIAGSLAMSVLDWNLLSPDIRFAGAAHYVALAQDGEFAMAARNTAWYVVLLVPAQIVLPLGLAVCLANVVSGWLGRAYRGILFLPTILAYSVAGIVWSWLLNPVNGVVNEALAGLGLPRGRWHTDPDLALYCVAAVTFWKTFGLNMLLWLAALVGIPREVKEAAQIDGAGPWRRFWHVELPLVAPTAFFIAVTTVAHVLDDIVGVIDVLTRGGPAQRTTSLLYYLWQRGLGHFQFGPASAVAVVIILLVLVVTALQFRAFERRVFYG